MWRKFLRFVFTTIFTILTVGCAFGQQSSPPASANPATTAPTPNQTSNPPQPQSGVVTLPDAPSTHAANKEVDPSKQQPKRILGIMPNYRAVSAGAIPPPPTPKEAFKIATQNSFDYSSFIFVGITSLIAEGNNAHPELGKGAGGFGQYYWRGFVDKTDGNYMVIFLMPTIFHQDERYYSMGEGPFLKRAVYAASRVLITPNYQGKNGFNTSEILGRGVAQGISASYYPAGDRSFGDIASKYGWAIGRDALTNVFREFWPDIATHVLHRHP
jgi:hypothetical protein